MEDKLIIKNPEKMKGYSLPFREVAVAVAMAMVGSAAMADQELAEKFPQIANVPLMSLPPLGSIPTYYVNLDALTMADLLRRDREEGRKYFSKGKPSHLEKFIVKRAHLPVGNSSGNGFSQGNPNICITEINASIPAWNNWNDPPASFNAPIVAARTCTTNPAVGPITRSSPALTSLYTSFGVKVVHNPGFKVQVLNKIGENVSAVQANPEPAIGWGTSFFDTNGTGGRLQEVVWINAAYIYN